jgi:hypothetical protein
MVSPKLQLQAEGWLVPTPAQGSELGLVPLASPPCGVQIFQPVLEAWMFCEIEPVGAAAARRNSGIIKQMDFIGGSVPGGMLL